MGARKDKHEANFLRRIFGGTVLCEVAYMVASDLHEGECQLDEEIAEIDGPALDVRQMALPLARNSRDSSASGLLEPNRPKKAPATPSATPKPHHE